MSAPARPALSAIAFQLAGAIEQYQSDFDRLVQEPRNLEGCRHVSRELDELLMLKGALPQLSVQMVELLVCHTELMHVFWGAVRMDPVCHAELVLRHREASEAMRRKCLRLFSRD